MRILLISPLPTAGDDGLPEDLTLERIPQGTAPVDWLRDHGRGIGIVVTTSLRGLSRAEIDLLPDLRFVANFGAGLDRLDLDALNDRNIAVANTPTQMTDDVADLAIILAMAGLRRLHEAERFVRAGEWRNGPFPLARSVRGARLGILGYGRIGRAVAARGEAMGLEVGYVGRPDGASGRHRLTDPERLAEWSDVMVVALPETSATRGLVDEKLLKALGPEGYLVNVGRGATVDEPALVEALAQGALGGAALDVFEHEPDISPSLLPLPGLTLTPHIGSATAGARAQMADAVFAAVRAWLAGNSIAGLVR